MDVLVCSLALLSGVIGAGFASGREILRFFAGHGPASLAAALCACAALCWLCLRLCSRMERCGVSSLGALCMRCFGGGPGRMAQGLFFLLSAVTGGAMLAACAELAALVLPVRHAYALGMAATLLVSVPLASRGLAGLAAPGAALCALLPAMLLRLYALPPGEACFLPTMTPDVPVRAAVDGFAYAALNAAMISGALPALLRLPPRRRLRAALLFAAVFCGLLLGGVAVCRRHLPALLHRPLPFVHLSRRLGPGGYLLLAACMYAAAQSTLCAMLLSLARLAPRCRLSWAIPGACCLLFALIGFGPIVESGYPVLGMLCAGLLLLLCFAHCDSPSAR